MFFLQEREASLNQRLEALQLRSRGPGRDYDYDYGSRSRSRSGPHRRPRTHTRETSLDDRHYMDPDPRYEPDPHYTPGPSAGPSAEMESIPPSMMTSPRGGPSYVAPPETESIIQSPRASRSQSRRRPQKPYVGRYVEDLRSVTSPRQSVMSARTHPQQQQSIPAVLVPGDSAVESSVGLGTVGGGGGGGGGLSPGLGPATAPSPSLGGVVRSPRPFVDRYMAEMAAARTPQGSPAGSTMRAGSTASGRQRAQYTPGMGPGSQAGTSGRRTPMSMSIAGSTASARARPRLRVDPGLATEPVPEGMEIVTPGPGIGAGYGPGYTPGQHEAPGQGYGEFDDLEYGEDELLSPITMESEGLMEMPLPASAPVMEVQGAAPVPVPPMPQPMPVRGE